MERSSLTTAERAVLDAIARHEGDRSALGRSLRGFSAPPLRGRRFAAAGVVLLPLAVTPLIVCALCPASPALVALAAAPLSGVAATMTWWAARGDRTR